MHHTCTTQTCTLSLNYPPPTPLCTQHNYNCKASKWDEPGNFIELMKTDLKSLLATTATTRSETAWNDWVDARPVWVTETSCALQNSKPNTLHSALLMLPFCGSVAIGT